MLLERIGTPADVMRALVRFAERELSLHRHTVPLHGRSAPMARIDVGGGSARWMVAAAAASQIPSST